LCKLWLDAGLADVETREISVIRAFDSFDDFWASSLFGTAGQVIAKMSPVEADRLEKR
jgi:hypothetical protein